MKLVKNFGVLIPLLSRKLSSAAGIPIKIPINKLNNKPNKNTKIVINNEINSKMNFKTFRVFLKCNAFEKI